MAGPEYIACVHMGCLWSEETSTADAYLYFE